MGGGSAGSRPMATQACASRKTNKRACRAGDGRQAGKRRVQRFAGGPRAGKGGALRKALGPVAATETNAASACGSTDDSCTCCGGAPARTHKGQSCSPPAARGVPSSSIPTNWSTPAAVQTSCCCCVRTSGDAAAAPNASTNHTSTKRARLRHWYGFDILRLSALRRSACSPDHARRRAIDQHQRFGTVGAA